MQHRLLGSGANSKLATGAGRCLPALVTGTPKQLMYIGSSRPHQRPPRVILQEDVESGGASRNTSQPGGPGKSPADGMTAPSVARGSTQIAQASWTSYLALFGVAILWGSYTPAIRLLYQIDTPPDPPLMNALQACLSAAFLVFANLTATTFGGKFNHPERAMPLMAEDSAVMKAILRKDHAASKELLRMDNAAAAKSAALSSSANEAAAAMVNAAPLPPRRAPSNAVEHVLASALNWRSNQLVVAGAEVGLWMSLAFSLEVAGLQLASATKVAFLNQVSVLITPLLVHMSGERVRGLEWLACGLGLVGSVLVAADSLMSGGGGEAAHGAHAAVAAGQGNEVLGLIFVLISAVFFALSTVRLGRYSSMYEPLQLSTVSMCTLGVCSLVWITAAVMGQADGGAMEWQIVNTMMGSVTCVLTLLWVGLGPGALAAYLQATGQRSVPPAQAQVIYSTTPLWAAGFAFLALDASDEAMGSIAWVGAAVMLGSSLMTAMLPPDNTDSAHEALSVSSIDSDDEADAGRPLVEVYARGSAGGSARKA